MPKPSPSAPRARRCRALAAAALVAAAAGLVAAAQAAAAAPSSSNPAVTAQWETYLAQLGRSSVGTTQGMDPFTAHRFTTPLQQVRSSAAYTGPNARLRRVVDALQRGGSGGSKVKVVAIGGVATNGSDASAVGSTDYVSRYANFLVNAFPKAEIQIVRASAGLAPSAVVAGCPDQFLSAARDADVVLLEMVPSDAPASEDVVIGAKLPAAYEALVRQALEGSKKPAVLLVQGMAPGQGNARTPFYVTPEAPHYSAVAAYYGVPYTSLRNALWEAGATNADGLLTSSAVSQTDGSTPYDAGHAALADALVYQTQQTVVDLAALPYGAFDDSAQNGDVPTQTMYASVRDAGARDSLLKDVSCAWIKGSNLSSSCPASIKDMCAADYRSRSAFQDSYRPGSSGLSTGALVGVIVGSIVGGLLLIGLIVGLCVCNRRRNSARLAGGKLGSGGGSDDVGVVIDDDATAAAKKQAQAAHQQQQQAAAAAPAPRPSIDGWNAALPEPPRQA
jgi:hypothetical protein